MLPIIPLFCCADFGVHYSEEDVVILDIPDGRPQKSVSIVTWQEENQEALRLLNVALSRARAKVFVVAQTEWLGTKCAKTSTLGELLRQLTDHHAPFRFVASRHKDPTGRGQLLGREEAMGLIQADISAVNSRLMLRYAASACDGRFPPESIRRVSLERDVEVAADCLYAGRDLLRQRLSVNDVSVAPLKPLETICRIDDKTLWLCRWVCPELKYADRPTIGFQGRRTVSVLTSLLGL